MPSKQALSIFSGSQKTQRPTELTRERPPRGAKQQSVLAHKRGMASEDAEQRKRTRSKGRELEPADTHIGCAPMHRAAVSKITAKNEAR